jgi:hypothetical protein
MRKRLATRKILVATLGVGAVSYVTACGSNSGNLLPPPPQDAAPEAMIDGSMQDVVTSGNLMGPPPDTGTGTEASTEEAGMDAGMDVTSGNLMAPPPDASNDGG